MPPIQSLKPQFKIDEDAGFVQDQIKERVRSEDNYTYCKGYPIIKSHEVTGRAGKPTKN
jgi:hypothetical protein